MARGMLSGITLGTTRAHIARAGLESIAYQTRELTEAMEADTAQELRELRVDGGASANDFLMQFQADILRVPVVRPKVVETTALGAAYLAGLAVGFWKNRDEVHRAWELDRAFQPRMSEDEAAHRRSRWSEALRRAKQWEEVH